MSDHDLQVLALSCSRVLILANTQSERKQGAKNISG